MDAIVLIVDPDRSASVFPVGVRHREGSVLGLVLLLSAGVYLAGARSLEAAPRNEPNCEHSFEGCEWMKELPSAFRVKKTFAGPQAEAAFAALLDYIETRTGLKQTDERGWHPTVADRMLEYLQALQPDVPFGELRTKRYEPRGQARFLFEDANTRLDMLVKILPKEAVDFYVAKQRAAAEQKPAAVAGGEIAAEDARLIEKDVTDAQRAHTSLIVFGIKLGAALRLPACSEGGLPPCVRAGDMGQAFAALLPEKLRTVGGVATGTPVSLPRSSCPSWVTECAVYLTMRGNIPVGAFIYTDGSEEEAVGDALNEKYGKHMTLGNEVHTCTNNLTGVRTSESRERFWRVPGLTVVYAPSVTCQALGSQGTLIIKLRSLVEATQKRRKDSERKL